MGNKKKRSQQGSSDETVSPKHKIPHAETNSNMASPLSTRTSSESVPNLKDIYGLLLSIQGTENNKVSTDMAELKSSVAKNNNDVTKIKEEMSQQYKYVASLVKENR